MYVCKETEYNELEADVSEAFRVPYEVLFTDEVGFASLTEAIREEVKTTVNRTTRTSSPKVPKRDRGHAQEVTPSKSKRQPKTLTRGMSTGKANVIGLKEMLARLTAPGSEWFVNRPSKRGGKLVNAEVCKGNDGSVYDYVTPRTYKDLKKKSPEGIVEKLTLFPGCGPGKVIAHENNALVRQYEIEPIYYADSGSMVKFD